MPLNVLSRYMFLRSRGFARPINGFIVARRRQDGGTGGVGRP